jgi:hypothetical protein
VAASKAFSEAGVTRAGLTHTAVGRHRRWLTGRSWYFRTPGKKITVPLKENSFDV